MGHKLFRRMRRSEVILRARNARFPCVLFCRNLLALRAGFCTGPWGRPSCRSSCPLPSVLLVKGPALTLCSENLGPPGVPAQRLLDFPAGFTQPHGRRLNGQSSTGWLAFEMGWKGLGARHGDGSSQHVE